MGADPTEEATAPLGDDWSSMTYPLYRPLLPLVGTGAADREGVRPVARLARLGTRPIGLAIAELRDREPSSAALVSLFVAPHVRDHGVATTLIAGLERDLARRGVGQLSGVYMTGKPAVPALERVFEKRGFSTPARRTVIVKFLPEEPARAEWYQNARMPDRASVFPWTELTAEERETLRESQAARGWIHPELEPWGSDQPDFDPVSSVGMRKDGEVVGWVINHRIAGDLVRFTTSFMRTDLARRGAIFPLYVSALKRLEGTGVTCTFVTANNFESMVRFVLRRVAPYVSFCGETRGVSKTLDAPVEPGR